MINNLIKNLVPDFYQELSSNYKNKYRGILTDKVIPTVKGGRYA